MPKRQVYLIDEPNGKWKEFLSDYLSETSSTLHAFDQFVRASTQMDKIIPDMIFIHETLVSPAFEQKIKILKETNHATKVFKISQTMSKVAPEIYKGLFLNNPALFDFQKEIAQHFTFMNKLDILVVDDEREIGAMVKDFLELRKNPGFEVRYEENGDKGLKSILRKTPDVVLLDIKMPVKDGRDVYREIKTRKIDLPVILFFDSMTGDEMVEIRKYGNPPVIEKGARESALPEVLLLIKKLAYFG